MTPLSHAVFGLGLTLVSFRALDQRWLPDDVGDPAVAASLKWGVPLAMATGSALALAAGAVGKDAQRAFRDDALSALAAFAGIFLVALGGVPRDTIGLAFVLVVVVRFAPAGWWAVRHGAPPPFVFALCFLFYTCLAAWRVAASLPFGDQVFYLLSADRLAHGSLDATIDPARFVELLTVQPQPVDATTHVAAAPAGPRLVQGYALPVLILPGWVVAGQVGATVVLCAFAAWTALQTWLLLGETVADARLARVTAALAAFCAPLVLLAVHVLPNVVGAALIATAYRSAFTARVRRPALAGALLGATAFLNPRDGLALLTLAPFALRWPRADRVAFTAAAAALVALAALVSLITFGIPVPYAGYVFGTAAAQTIDPEPTWTFRFWIGLPAILFDRVFGIAGTAPWLLIAFLGTAPALRAARERLLPAAITIGAGLALLSLFRLWEGGYAPPNRYLVDVLPLAAPLVAYGLAAARTLATRAFVVVATAMSSLATLFLLAVPSAALNSAFEDKPQGMLAVALGVDPLGWLPSFQPVTEDWWIGAYLRLIPALALVAFLAWTGVRRART